MIRVFKLLLAVMPLLLVGCSQGKPVTLRVLTYNIHHGEGVDGQIDLERIAGVIRQAEPDLVALQEVDRGVQRTARVDEPARLAELVGMRAVFERNIEYQGGDYGNAVLSRLPIIRHENHFLPQSLPKEQRGMLEVHVRVSDRTLVFLATHFDYHPDDGERMASAKVVREFVEKHPDLPIILAGDLNARPDSPPVSALTAFLTDTFVPGAGPGHTYPAATPDRRIDYILHNRHPAIRSLECRVLAEPVASDHRPVLAVFEINP
jgi:endonuclease/exonuclease/phosphatase family metal-dependent hydrolase